MIRVRMPFDVAGGSPREKVSAPGRARGRRPSWLACRVRRDGAAHVRSGGRCPGRRCCPAIPASRVPGGDGGGVHWRAAACQGEDERGRRPGVRGEDGEVGRQPGARQISWPVICRRPSGCSSWDWRWEQDWQYDRAGLEAAAARLERLHAAAGRPDMTSRGRGGAPAAVSAALADDLDVPTALGIAEAEGGSAAAPSAPCSDYGGAPGPGTLMLPAPPGLASGFGLSAGWPAGESQPSCAAVPSRPCRCTGSAKTGAARNTGRPAVASTHRDIAEASAVP